MRFYEVTNKELAKEVKEQVERLVEITNKFLEVSVSYGFDGLAMDSVGLSSDIADVFCRGFYANTNNLTTEQKRKFKLVSKGRVAVPKKAYEAEAYKKDYNGNQFESMVYDTLPLFKSDEYAIRDWASNNMNWSDVKNHAVCVEFPDDNVDYDDGWCNGAYEIKE